MRRFILGVWLVLGAVFGGVAWGIAVPDAWRLVYGVVPVVGIALLVVTIARLREGDRIPVAGASRLIVYCLTASAVLHVLLFSPFFAPRAFLVMHLAIVVGAAILMWRGKHRPGAPAIPLLADVVCAGVLILLLGAEITLRVWASVEPRALFAQRDMTPAARIAAMRFAPGRIVDGTPANQDGFRDATFDHQEGRRSVLVLGDRAFALGVPALYAPTAIASAATPGTVFWNATLPSTGPLEAEELLHRLAAEVRPDAVVHVISLDDDLVDLERTPEPWTPWAMVLDRENVLSALLVDRILARIEENGRLGDRADPPLLERVDSRDALRAKLPWLDDPKLERPRLSAETIRARSRRAIAVSAGSAGRARATGLVAVEARMASFAAEKGIAFGTMVLPARYQIDDALWEQVGGDADRDAPRAEIVQGLRAHDIRTQDLAVLFGAIPRASELREHLFHSGDLALGVEGARLAGDGLKALCAQLLPQKDGPK